MRDHTIYSCVMGSRAFGLATEDSDTDRRGVFLAPTALFWRLRQAAHPHRGSGRRAVLLGAGAVLRTGAARQSRTSWSASTPRSSSAIDDTGRELLSLRGAFLSRRGPARPSSATPRDSAESWTRMSVSSGAPRWKPAMHLVRLLMSCRRAAAHGGTRPRRRRRARAGSSPSSAVRCPGPRWKPDDPDHRGRPPRGRPLHSLPGPDRARVEDFLIRVRRSVSAPV